MSEVVSGQTQQNSALAPGRSVTPSWPPVRSRPARPPRVWSALVMGVLSTAVCVGWSIAAVIFLLATDPMPRERLTDPAEIEAAIQELLLEPTSVVLMVLPLPLFVIGIACLGGVLSPVSFQKRLSLSPSPWRWWSLLVLVPGTWFVGLGCAMLLTLLFDAPSDNQQFLSRLFRDSNPILAGLIALDVVVLAGLGEELLFRGYVQSRLLQRWRPIWALLTASALFALAHLDVQHSLTAFGAGLWLGVIAWRAGSIWPAVICHASQNALTIVMARLSSPDTLSTVTGTDLILLGVTFPFFYCRRMAVVATPAHATGAKPTAVNWMACCGRTHTA